MPHYVSVNLAIRSDHLWGTVMNRKNFHLHRLLLSIAGALVLGTIASPPAAVAQIAGPSAEQRADQLISALTLEQKIQQISNRAEDIDLPSGTYLAQGNKIAECGFTRLARHITGIPELGIPTFREINNGNGIRGGACTPEPVRTAGPSMTLAAASFDPERVESWGEVVGSETFSFAHQVLLGPVINLMRSPYAGRGQESPGEDPYLAGTIAIAQIKGIQSQGVQAQPKHFAGNEHEFQFERWTAAVHIPSRALHELYLLPFEMVVKDAQPASIMCAYPHINGAYACDNHALLVQTLRQRWGFDGWVESDRRAMHSTVDALLAGVGYELDSEPRFYTENKIMAALAAGDITEQHIDAALRPRYVKMFEFDQFENPFNQIINVDLDANAAKARALVEGGITLLKNDVGTLPLKPNVQSIALIGHKWFAGSATMPPRNLSPSELTTVVAPYTVTPKQGLENTLAKIGGSATVTYNDGTDIASAVNLAMNSDVVILMVGTNPRETRDLLKLTLPTLCTNDGDPSDPDPSYPSDSGLPGTIKAAGEVCVEQDQLVREVAAANPNNVVVLYSAGGVIMNWLDLVPALVAAWFPGQDDGDVVADILFGVINPSGKLPVSFPTSEHEAAFATEMQYPGTRENNGLPGGPGFPLGDGSPQLVSHYSENLEMGYRWYEANGVKPAFAFGHGLSFTTFEYNDLRLKRKYRRVFEQVPVPGTGRENIPQRFYRRLVELVPVLTVEYTLTNTGSVAGAEASQIYLELPRQANQPSKRLVGFKKVFLEPNESARITVDIDASAPNHPFSSFVPDDPDNLAAWAEGEWVSHAGAYRVHVGGSSAETPLVQRVGMAFPRINNRSARR